MRRASLAVALVFALLAAGCAGLGEFAASGPRMWEVVGVLGPLHAAPEVWEKISDVLADYTQWCAVAPDLAAQGTAAYDPVSRLLARQPLVGTRRKGERE